MDRESRDHRAASPSREARAALLGAIAQRRAAKTSSSTGASVTAIAHSTPLPESDDSASDKEEFSTPENFKSENSRPITSAVVEDDLGGVLDRLGNLSLGGSRFASENSGTSGFQRLKNVSDVSSKNHKNAPIVSSSQEGALRTPAGYADDPVELSSDDSDGFVPRKVTKQNGKLVDKRISAVNYSLKKSFSKLESKENVDHELLTVISKARNESDMILDGGRKPYVLPGKIASILYQHQQEGIRWLWGLHLKGMGGILGDDMGLGKTMQIAAFFAGLFESKLMRTAMIVAPKTLIGHWVKELTSVGLSRKIFSFVDTSSKVRETALHRVLQMGGVLLTTYDMVRCNWKALSGDFHGRDGYGDNSEDIVTWDYCVLDEGHLVKNPNTERAKSLRAIPSGHRVIISGTPIQNNLKEMWALMDFCCPNLLGDQKEFKYTYEQQIVDGNDKHASDRQKRLGTSVAQELRQKIAPFFLRRMKSDVFPEEVESSEVPKLSRKNDLIVWLRLTARQEQLYRAFLKSDAVVNALHGSNALTALAVMKKICDHPSLLTKRAAEDIAEGMEGMMGDTDRATAEALIDSLAGLVEHDDDCVEAKGAVSCKMDFLFILMEKLLESGHRTLIFSQTRKMLNIIQAEIETRKWRYCRIDGTLNSSDRAAAVQDFQSRPDIPFFLLTSQVGGLGLTLTAANRVVIVDPAWNPSVDNQSVDRAYRIGQKKDVTVYRLMTCGTLEEKVYRKQVFKGGLMKIATENKNQMRYFSRQELHELFIVPKTGFSVSVTQKQLSEEHFGEHRSSKELEEDIRYLEGLDMIAGVSHHDVLYSKAAPALPPPKDDEDDANVKWEPRNAAYAAQATKPAPPKSTETYSWDQTNALSGRIPLSGEIYDPAKHAWLRVSFLKDKIKRMAATLENEGTVSKLSDGGAKLMAKIKELNAEVQKLKVTAAPYEERLAIMSRDSHNTDDGNNNSDGSSPSGQETVGQKAAAGEVVRVRTASGNNIYNSPSVGMQVRKLPVVAAVSSESRVSNLEGALGSLKV